MEMKKEKISCPAIGDCNPSDCSQPEKAASCPEWNRYKKTRQGENLSLKSTSSKSKGVKKTRGKDFILIERLLADLSGMKDIFPLVPWKALLLHYKGPQEENSCAYIRVLNKDGVLPPGANIFEAVAVHSGAKLAKDERMLNKRVLEGIAYMNKAMNALAGIVLTDKKRKQWLVDRMGPGCKRLLPDWNKYQKKDKGHAKPDFQKAVSIFDKFIGGTSALKLGYRKSTYHHFKDKISPQAGIVLLEWLHNVLYGKIDETEFLRQTTPDPQKFVSGLMQIAQSLKRQ